MMIRCPKCGFEQPEEEYCAKCGVHIATYYSSSKQNEQEVSSKTLWNFVSFSSALTFVLIGLFIWNFLASKKNEQIRMRAATPPNNLRFIESNSPEWPQTTQTTLLSIKQETNPESSAQAHPPHFNSSFSQDKENPSSQLKTAAKEETSSSESLKEGLKANHERLGLYWSHFESSRIMNWLEKSLNERQNPLKLNSILSIPLSQELSDALQKSISWEPIETLVATDLEKQSWLWPPPEKKEELDQPSNHSPFGLQVSPLDYDKGWGLAIWYQPIKDESSELVEFPFLKLEKTEQTVAYLIVPKLSKIAPDYKPQGAPKTYLSLLRYLGSKDFLASDEELVILALFKEH